VLTAAVKRPLTAADVAAAVGQLGDNTLAPSTIDMSQLDLDAGAYATHTLVWGVCVCVCACVRVCACVCVWCIVMP
jgi:hypothetical protein